MDDKKRKVSELCFEYLFLEVVMGITKTSKNQGEIQIKLENIGVIVGHKLVESLTEKLPIFMNPTDKIKFICVDFWTALFNKKVDRLDTNNKGSYRITDNYFQWAAHISSNDQTKTTQEIEKYVAFLCGLIKGALVCMNVLSIIQLDITKFPSCMYLFYGE
jgi:trafficking protein particle complex subunit 6